MKSKKQLARIRRKKKIRKRIKGTGDKPRLCVSKSLKNIYLQIIDDSRAITLSSVSTLEKELKDKLKNGSNLPAARLAGEIIAERAKSKKITKIVFDRNGFLYQGKIKAIAEGAREKGLIF